MTEQRNDGNDKRLETLYREAGDVEPEAGLDRIIRARADEAIGTRRSSNRLPWLGGLVTASVALVAIAVVLQQAPPAGTPMPESPGPLESGEPEVFMAPSLGADAALNSSNEARRARSEVRQMQSAGVDASDEAPPPAALRAPGRKLSEEQRAERLGDIVTDRVSELAEPSRSLPEENAETTGDDPVAMLARIEALIEADAIQDARDLLDTFRREYPGHAVPKKIQETLAPPE